MAPRVDVLSHPYSASHHNGIDTGIFFFVRCLDKTAHPRWPVYTSAGVSAGLNLSWAMISGRLLRLRSGIGRHPVTAPFGAMLQTWPEPVPAPGASKVVMVCADIGMEIARATRMVAAGWGFLFAK
jgi:hypothetical protein